LINILGYNMNIKIIELAINSGADLRGDAITTEMLDIEKFTESIIRECIGDFERKIKIRYAGDQKSMDVGYGMEIVIDSIKQKFGML